MFAVNDRIEIETPDGWIPGTFVEFVGSIDPSEDFLRCDVRADGGGFYSAAHPECIRAAA